MRKFLLPLLILVIFTSFVTPKTIFAQSQRDVVKLLSGQNASNDYFASSNAVTLSGSVVNDAYVLGSTVVIEGQVGGDLLIAGGNVTINGEIANNIRAVGGNIIISGKVGKNVSVVGGSVVIGSKASIGGNVVSLAGNFDSVGEILGSLKVMGGSAAVEGKVAGNVEANVDRLTVGNYATIGGNLNYTGQEAARISRTAVISGSTIYIPKSIATPPKDLAGKDKPKLLAAWYGLNASLNIISLITAFIIGFICLKLFPRCTLHSFEILDKSMGKSLIVGLAALIVLPVAAVLLLVTIVGIPMAILVFTAFLFIIYFAKIIVGFYIGRRILLKLGMGDRRGWSLLTGLVIYYLILMIPFIGWIVKLAVLFAGMGVIILEKAQFYKSLSAKKML